MTLVGHYRQEIVIEHERGIECDTHGLACGGYWKITDDNRDVIGTQCRCGGTMVVYERDMSWIRKHAVCECGDEFTAEERYVWGIPAGIHCDKCFDKKFTKEPFDPMYAGERLEDDY